MFDMPPNLYPTRRRGYLSYQVKKGGLVPALRLPRLSPGHLISLRKIKVSCRSPAASEAESQPRPRARSAAAHSTPSGSHWGRPRIRLAPRCRDAGKLQWKRSPKVQRGPKGREKDGSAEDMRAYESERHFSFTAESTPSSNPCVHSPDPPNPNTHTE
ncbi:hypothetical protein VUR80DRAFT_6727 [Thermomyces stellatus]